MWTKIKIKRHIDRLSDDTLISTREVLHYGPRKAVDSATKALVDSGFLVRLAWGIFAKSTHPSLSEISAFEVASKKAEAFGKRMLANAAAVAIELGLNAKPRNSIVYATDGCSTKFRLLLHKTVVRFEGTRARVMRLESDSAVTKAIRGLWCMTEPLLAGDLVQKATCTMGRMERQEFLGSFRWMPGWLSDYIQELRAATWQRHQLKEQRLRLYESQAQQPPGQKRQEQKLQEQKLQEQKLQEQKLSEEKDQDGPNSGLVSESGLAPRYAFAYAITAYGGTG